MEKKKFFFTSDDKKALMQLNSEQMMKITGGLVASFEEVAEDDSSYLRVKYERATVYTESTYVRR